MTNRNKALLQPRLGLGTWRMGFSEDERAAEVAALRAGVEIGVNVIDTAEMYADGGAEEVVGEAIRGLRDQIYLVTKVLPSNASYEGTIQACEQSLRRLGVEQIDLYLLHWPSSYPLDGTVDAFEALHQRGLIKRWGVSNFDSEGMAQLWELAAGSNCVANQVYYSLGSRGVEFDLLPWQKERDVATMAYCPLDQGRLVNDERLRPLADKHNVTIAQIALAWAMTFPDVIPIPKSAKVSRVIENAKAREIALDGEDHALLNQLFPPPAQAVPLRTT